MYDNVLFLLTQEIPVQIPLHRVTDSANNGSVFPVVLEHFSASSDHARGNTAVLLSERRRRRIIRRAKRL